MKLSDLTQPFRRQHSDGGPGQDSPDDLGFGDKVVTSGGRLINRDGSFNIVRRGYQSWAPYQHLAEMPWPRFALMVFLFFVAVNAVFACFFMLCGRLSLSGVDPTSGLGVFFLESFFFSIQTFTTVGYGSVSPLGWAANFVASLDALVGLMSFALATGLVFARFSKPRAQILFSRKALITPYRHRETGDMIDSLQFRIVNARNNKLINLEVTVVMTWLEVLPGGHPIRRYATLPLERRLVTLLPLNWTIVHPIDEQSPLHGKTRPELTAGSAEILIMIQGYDDSFAQNVHTNSSYTCKDLEWGLKFAPMYHAENGSTVLDLDKLDETAALEQ